MLPEGCSASIDAQSWSLPPVFQWLQSGGNVESAEMHRTFNCGVGMVVIVAPAKADAAMQLLKDLQVDSWIIGQICDGNRQVEMGL